MTSRLLFVPKPLTEPVTAPEQELLNQALLNNEKGKANFLFSLISENLIYDPFTGKWFVWDINHWQYLVNEMLLMIISDNMNEAFNNILMRLESVSRNSLKPRIDDAIIQSGGIRKINDIISFLKSKYAQKYTDPIQWNNDLSLLPIIVKDQTGKRLPQVLDLKTGKMIQARKEDLLTRFCPIEIEKIFPYEKSDLPLLQKYGISSWDEYLHICENDPQHNIFFVPGLSKFDDFQQDVTGYLWCKGKSELELLKYKQRIMGMILMTPNEQQKCIFCTGDGSNGKSLEFTDVLPQLLGNDIVYSGANADLFKKDPRGNKDKTLGSYLVQMGGKSFTVFSEPDDDKRIKYSPSAIKHITGERTIKADGKYMMPQNVSVTFTPIILANGDPDFSSVDKAIWRRIIILPYTENYIEKPDPSNKHEHKLDLEMDKKIIQDKSAALAWYVRGCMAYWNHGDPTLGEMPRIVKEAIDQIKNDNDPYADFIADCVTIAPNVSIKASDFYRNYENYMRIHGEYNIPSKTQFGKDMSKRYTRVDSGGSRYYKNVCVSIP
jgi:putative DNA primase/helicase